MLAEKFTNLGKERDIHVQEAQRMPNKMSLKSFTSTCIIMEWKKKKNNLKSIKKAPSYIQRNSHSILG